MSWICSNCSNSNSESEFACAVCGTERPTHTVYPESTESKVVFSTLGVIVESTKCNIKSFIGFTKKLFSLAKKTGDGIAAAEEGTTDRLSTASSSDTLVEKSERLKDRKSSERKRARNSFDAPWPEDNFELDISAIKSKGYVRLERGEYNSVKGYYFYNKDGTSRFIRSDMLVVLKLAKTK